MDNKLRKEIVLEVKKRMKETFVEFCDFQPGEFETKQDEYIEIVCKEKGFELSDFYNADGRYLSKLLDIIS